jgi:hypothetical protein
MTTLDRADVRQLLTGFDAAANDFFEAFAVVPDAALAFRPENDDYALSGLLIHVAGGLEFYGSVLAQMIATNFEPLTVSGAPDPRDAALTHDGIAPSERASTIARVRAAHEQLARLLERGGDIQRTAEVRFGEGADPLPTSAVDIVGWMREHYREHIAHIDELLGRWRS